MDEERWTMEDGRKRCEKLRSFENQKIKTESDTRNIGILSGLSEDGDRRTKTSAGVKADLGPLSSDFKTL